MIHNRRIKIGGRKATPPNRKHEAPGPSASRVMVVCRPLSPYASSRHSWTKDAFGTIFGGLWVASVVSAVFTFSRTRCGGDINSTNVPLQNLVDSPVDFLVIGGGTSGLVLAARLAQGRPDKIIAVLEAGKYHENDPLVDIPGMVSRALWNPDYDWSDQTVPQKHASNRNMVQSHGKGLGGSTILNFMAYVRPSKEELDAIEQLGNPGWNWQTLSAAMKKSERLEAPKASMDGNKIAAVPDPAAHGATGPISISFSERIHEFHVPLLDSLEKLGVPRNPEAGNGRQMGAFFCPNSVDPKTATRSHAAAGYFAPNKQLPNLLVVTEARALKINFTSGANGLKRATSVDVEKDGKVETITSRQEIVLSAGSLRTPQVLELSGIGNPEILKSLNVDCLIDLPSVGENLQDHGYCMLVVQTDQSFESFEAFTDPDFLAKHQQLYAEQKGLLAAAPASIAYLPAQALVSEAELEEWEKKASAYIKSTSPAIRQGVEKQYQILRSWLRDPNQPFGQILTVNAHYPLAGYPSDPSKRYASLLFVYSHPFARGSVHVTSNDPHVPPAIDPNYLSNDIDADVLVRLLSLLQKVAKTAPFSDVVAKTVVPTFREDASEDVVRKYIADTINTIHHPIGTASMLPRNLGGVVDPKLCVYGTENLRVVDCSILPLEITANTQSIAYAIGEKAADIVLHNL